MPSIPSPKEIAQAKSSSRELSALLKANGELLNIQGMGVDGETHSLKLPTIAVQLMIEVLAQLGQGNGVSINPIHAELTTQQAADMLNMSRPTFIKLLDSGVIAHSRTGNRRKVAFVEVMRYKQEIDSKRLSALDELSALDQELSLGF